MKTKDRNVLSLLNIILNIEDTNYEKAFLICIPK